MSTATREDSVYLAKLAEQAERYEGEYWLASSQLKIVLTLPQRWSRT